MNRNKISRKQLNNLYVRIISVTPVRAFLIKGRNLIFFVGDGKNASVRVRWMLLTGEMPITNGSDRKIYNQNKLFLTRTNHFIPGIIRLFNYSQSFDQSFHL